MREVAARALGALGDPRALAALAATLRPVVHGDDAGWLADIGFRSKLRRVFDAVSESLLAIDKNWRTSEAAKAMIERDHAYRWRRGHGI